MFESFGSFKPSKRYSEQNMNYRFQYGKGLSCGIDIFVDIIIAESALRESVQRQERLKIIYTDDKEELRRYSEELEALRRKVKLQQRDLYNRESMLPRRPLKDTYDQIRQDPTWYLRKELIDDCIDRGGYCGRSCGCCENRHRVGERRKGIGHCTVECGCCASYQGFDSTEEEKKAIRDQLRVALWNRNPSYLLAMTEAYFSKPREFWGFTIREAVVSRWKRVFGKT